MWHILYTVLQLTLVVAILKQLTGLGLGALSMFTCIAKDH